MNSGIYLLLFSLKNSYKVGKLGTIKFDGTYLYVGSAQNNVDKRVLRHMSKVDKKHWHMDYLEDKRVLKSWKINASKEYECKFAKKLAEKFESVKGFGCSDCKCESHLFKI